MLIADTEERRLENINMITLNQVREELEEKGNQQETDMHSIDIGIRSNDNLIITKSFQAVFNIECGLQKIELFILIHNLLRQTITIQRFSSETEDRLEIRVAAFRDRTTGRISLGNEDATFLYPVALSVIQVDAAIAEFLIVEVRFLGSLPGKFRNAGNRFAFFLRILDFTQKDIGCFKILMEIIIEFFLNKVVDELRDRRTIRPHILRAKLRLRLTFKHRFFDFDTDSRNDTGTYIGIFKAFVEVFLDDTTHSFLESREVRTALRCELTIDKRVIFLAVLVAMGDDDLNVFAFQMDNRIERLGSHVLIQEVFQSFAGIKPLSVIENR